MPLRTETSQTGTSITSEALTSIPWRPILTLCSGKNGGKPEVEKFSGACYKHFRTIDQAKAFMEDWKSAVVDVYQRTIRESLNNGDRPPNMKLILLACFGNQRILLLRKLVKTLLMG